MDSKKFLIRLILLIFFIFLLNYLALQFYWYSSVWYIDMFMHFLGGAWAGLALIWFFRLEELSSKSILKIILGVLLIGVFWEIFEIIVNRITTENLFNVLDTASDIFFDLAGGLLAIFYFLKRVMSIKENTL